MRKELIELRGVKSRREIAGKLGITQQMLGAIERGARNPSRELTVKIARLYTISIDRLIFLLSKDT